MSRFPLPVLLLLAPACQGKATDDSGGSLAPVERGPTTLPVDGDPNGLWWDAETATLYLADDDNNRVLSWTDSEGFGLVGDLPEPGADGAGLGQLVRTSAGDLVVTRFGYGTTGDVVVLTADGTGSVVPSLDPERRRIGLALAPDGTLYDGWFISNDAGRFGEVSVLDLGGSETSVLTGLGKPVGVYVSAGSLYVADQDAGEILRAPLDAPEDVEVLAQVDGPDLICAAPDGGIFTGGQDGAIRQIAADGSVTTFASGYQEVRGVAWDEANGRLFFVDHDGDDSDGETNFLQILPVD